MYMPSFLCLFLLLSFGIPNPELREAGLRITPPEGPRVSYPDTTAGLQRLAKDILKAQKANDTVQTEILLRSLILPHPREWYERVFGPTIANNEGALYEREIASVAPTLARDFLDAESFNAYSIEARRFERSCDDNAGELTFGILHARIEPVPLYELIFLKDKKLKRIASFAYVDGGFRYIISPKLEGPVFPSRAGGADRVKTEANSQKKRLIKEVVPIYPQAARREHLEGTVKLHVLVGKDGTPAKVYVLRGYCSLAEASLETIRQWRFAPTLVNGNPVEVDTEVEVTFRISK